MLKLVTITFVLASVVAGLGATAASARTSGAECQAIYNKTLTDSQSDRNNRDDYISCLSNL